MPTAGIVSFGPLNLFICPTLGGVGCPSGPSVLSGEPYLPCGLWGMGSEGISLLMGGGCGAPEITTRGGAGEVLSFMGDRRGVMGVPPWKAGASEACRLGELTAGDDGPGDTADCL